MEKINLGLIGLGFIGKYHIKNCSKLDSANLVAVADLSKKALRLAKSMGVKRTFTDYHELLKEKDIDAVVISLPTHLHEPCATSAAEAGKHVFLEKPLARNPEEGKKILSAVTKNGVKLMVGYPLKFSSEFIDLKNKIDSGVLGEIQTAHAVNIASGPFMHRADSGAPRPVPDWWFNKDLTGGGALIDLGSHIINLAHWYFGEVESIKSYLGYRFNFDIEDYATCVAKFKSGTTVMFNVGWFSQKTALGVDLFGTVAHASGHRVSPNRPLTAIQLILGFTPTFFTPFLAEISHFVSCISEDRQPSPSGDDGLEDLETIAQAYKNQIRLD